MKYFRAIGALAFYCVLLLLVYAAYMKLLLVDVVFYASIYAGLIASVLFAGVLFTLPWFRVFSRFEKVQQLCLSVLLGYIFAISVPTVIDRSLSFYILEKLQQRGGGIQQVKFKQVFIDEYLPEHRLVDVRLTEQLQSGTVVIENGCVKLTPRGERLASFSRFFRANFLPRQRLLMGEYTDILIDPFAHKDVVPDYLCK